MDIKRTRYCLVLAESFVRIQMRMKKVITAVTNYSDELIVQDLNAFTEKIKVELSQFFFREIYLE